MFELSVTASCPCQIPTIFFKKLEDLLDLHSQMIKELLLAGKTSGEYWSFPARS